MGEHDQERIFTYAELYRQVNRCANALKKLGLQRGDRVTIYLPKIPEQVIAMLACARIGVIHSVVYSGFSAPALASRINDAEAKVVITADVGFDRGKAIQLKSVVDEAVKICQTIDHVVVVRRQIKVRPFPLQRKLTGRSGSSMSDRFAKQNSWMPKHRSIFSIRPARPVGRRALSMSMGGTWSAPIRR